MSRLPAVRLLFFLTVFLASPQAAFSQGLKGAGLEAGGPQNGQKSRGAAERCRDSLLPGAPSGPLSGFGAADSGAFARRQAWRQLQNLFSFTQGLFKTYVKNGPVRPKSRAIPNERLILRSIEAYLGRNLSGSEAGAFIKARQIGHEMGHQPAGRAAGPDPQSGQPAAAAFYTPGQLLQKRGILEAAGFSPAETEKLMENGATAYSFEGMDWSRPPQELMFFQNFLKGDISRETAYFLFQEHPLEGGGQTAGPGKIIKRAGPAGILAEVIDGGLQTREIDLRPQAGRALRTFLQGNPDLELAFKAIKSETKAVDFLPSSRQAAAIRREADRLRALGFGPAFLRGFEELMEAVLLKEALIKEAANPRATHIEYFAKKAPEHLAHIRAGLEDGGFIKSLELEGALPRDSGAEPVPPDPEPPKPAAALKAEALRQLDLLEKQAARKIQKKEASYVWWLEFNARLAKILSPLDGQSRMLKHYPDRIKALINLFPSQLLIPSVKGAMGVLALNRAGARGVHAIGLINKSAAADGRLMSPMEFAAHDVEHIYSFVQSLMGAYGGSIMRGFYLKYESLEAAVPAEKRKIFETVYFLLFPQGLDIGSPFFLKRGERLKERAFSREIKKSIAENIKTALRFQFNFKGLADFSKDPERRKGQIKSMAADFFDTAGLVLDKALDQAPRAP